MASDYAAAVKEKAEGFAAAANEIRSLVSEWRILFDANERLTAEINATRARLEQAERERDEAREIIGEYLNPICEAFERVQKIERHPPGSGISDPDYPGPTNDEIEQYDDEIMSARNDLTEAIQVACDAQEGE